MNTRPAKTQEKTAQLSLPSLHRTPIDRMKPEDLKQVVTALAQLLVEAQRASEGASYERT